MRFIVNKIELQQGIQETQRAVAVRLGASILLQCSKNHLTLTGGDKNLYIETKIVADVYEEGNILLDSRLFGEIVRKLPDSNLEIVAMNENRIKITCGKDVITLSCLNAESFPILPKIEEDISIAVPQDVFQTMIKKAIIATDPNCIRPIFSGILFDIKENMLVMVALDNLRSAICRYKGYFPSAIRTVVPGKTLNEIAKMPMSYDNNIKITFTKNHILFLIGSTKVVSTLLEGDFGNYDAFIPDEYSLEVTIKKDILIGHLERAAIIGRENNVSAVVFNIHENDMTIASNSSFGDITSSIDIKSKGMPLVIKCNSRFLLEALNTLEEDDVTMKFTTSESVLIITSSTNSDITHIIAPIRI